MKMPLDDNKLIYMQIADSIEDDIISGALNEGEQVYSTNQFAKLYGINPATAAKGINILVEEGILFKKRGIGMFVLEGARKKIINKRQSIFYKEVLPQIIEEADRLEISLDEIIDQIKKIKGGE